MRGACGVRHAREHLRARRELDVDLEAHLEAGGEDLCGLRVDGDRRGIGHGRDGSGETRHNARMTAPLLVASAAFASA
ncbi:MAG: hypothetical protein ACK56F_19395, partial [bacterium]